MSCAAILPQRTPNISWRFRSSQLVLAVTMANSDSTPDFKERAEKAMSMIAALEDL